MDRCLDDLQFLTDGRVGNAQTLKCSNRQILLRPFKAALEPPAMFNSSPRARRCASA
jgi:hypothetical protein